MSLLYFQVRGGKCSTMIFPFFQNKKGEKEKKKAWTWSTQSRILFPRQEMSDCPAATCFKPNPKQEEACLTPLTRGKSKVTWFQWQPGHWSADTLRCIKQTGCSVLILLFTYFLKRKTGLLLELLCARVSGMANTSVRSWFNVSLQV